MRTVLETTSEVMNALGGNIPVARLTGRTNKAVSNWRKFENFPRNTFLAMTSALAAKGMEAPPSLWDQKVPEKEDA